MGANRTWAGDPAEVRFWRGASLDRIGWNVRCLLRSGPQASSTMRRTDPSRRGKLPRRTFAGRPRGGLSWGIERVSRVGVGRRPGSGDGRLWGSGETGPDVDARYHSTPRTWNQDGGAEPIRASSLNRSPHVRNRNPKPTRDFRDLGRSRPVSVSARKRNCVVGFASQAKPKPAGQRLSL
jgi:hypothetical protein